MRIQQPPDLDADTLSIIDAARGGHEPNEMARARVRRGVEIKLAAGIALAVGPASSAFAGALKLTAAVVAVGTVVGAGVYAYPRIVAKPAPVHAPAAHVAPAPALMPPPPAEIEIRTPVVTTARVPARRHTPVVAAPVVIENVSGLREETVLLGAANAALGRGDVKRALAVLEEYDRRPGSAMLAEERTVTGILASCAAGHGDAARAEARRFHARWPRSPLAARVDASCAGTGDLSRTKP